MSRAVRFDEYGDVDVLRVEEVPDPSPGAAEVVVRVRATSINPGEARIRTGSLHAQFPATFPSGQGSDVAGVIESVGEGAERWSVGDEVLGWVDTRSAHAELVVVPASQLVLKPAGLGWAEAGSIHVAGATAWATVEAVGAAPGTTIVVAGATGGVGSLAVQLAVRAGASVIGIASERNHEWLRSHGVVPVAYGDGLEQRILGAAPDGIDAFIDTYGPPYVELAASLGLPMEKIDTIADFAAVAERRAFVAGNAAGATVENIEALAGLAASGELEIPIAASYGLDQVREAFTELAEGHTRGKIVLLP